jgi:hypothetical protein
MGDTINYPKKKFRIKGLSSAIFEKDSVTKQGEPVKRRCVSIQKSSKDPASGEWKNQQIFLFPNEIPALITVANKAYEHCLVNENGEE